MQPVKRVCLARVQLLLDNSCKPCVIKQLSRPLSRLWS